MGNEDPSMGNEVVRVYEIRGLKYSVFCAIGMAFPLVYVSQLCFSAMFLSRTSQKLN